MRQMARSCLPAAVVERYGVASLARRARRLSALAGRAATPSDTWDAIWQFDEFRPPQKSTELVSLLERVTPMRPQAICEIGAASGGTLCALSHAATESAIVISIDRDFTTARLKALPQLGRRGQHVTCIAGDSHEAATYSLVASLLDGSSLDFLFIDGDHTYAGLKADFEIYCGFVRPGGLIGFHDIVPDYKTRFGIATSADSGGVPAFWDELKRQFPETEDIVESQGQDGYGIGLLTWPG
jgi:predicted O-methyltransferase YrrM